MNRQELKKQTYVSPSIEIVHTTCNGRLMSTSFPNGGHKDGNDDGQDLNAKQGFFDEEDEEITNTESQFGSIW